MKAACFAWNESSEAVKKSWKLWAEFLNASPVCGCLSWQQPGKRSSRNPVARWVTHANTQKTQFVSSKKTLKDTDHFQCHLRHF